jgi:hypothetical protein
MKLQLSVLAACVLLVSVARAGDEPKPQSDKEALQGTWSRGHIEGGIIGPSLPKPPNLAWRTRPTFTPIRERGQVRLQLLVTQPQLLPVTLI